MPRKILYLVNPISGTGSKSALRDAIAGSHRQQGIGFEVYPTDPEGNYQALRGKLQEESFTDVVVCGGDGSVNAVAHALMGVDVNIGVIPLGSGNGLAFSAGIPKHTLRALRLIFTGTPSYIDGFYINDRFSCMLCGIGFDAKVAHDFSRAKTRGLKTYIKVTAANFISAVPYHFEIKTGEKSFSTQAYFISIANSNQFGNNFTIAPGADLSDGLLDIVVVQKMSKLVLPFVLFQHVAGSGATQVPPDEQLKQHILHFQAPALTILNSQKALLHIDGDPAETAEKFDIQVVPRAIRLIRPAQK